jgi:hypothetical protein
MLKMQDPKLNGFRTAKDIADDLGVHKTTVNRIAADYELGTFIGPMRLFSKKDEQEIKRFCRFQKGNPNFGKKSG